MRNNPLIGPIVAIFSAIAFFVISLMTWYTIDLGNISVGAKFAEQYAKQAGFATSANAWEPWGLLSDFLMLAVIIGAIALGALIIAGGAETLAQSAGLLGIGIVGALLVLFHILSGPQPSAIVTVEPISWLGALAALGIVLGGYLSFDYAQHGAAGTSSAPDAWQEPEETASRGGLWDDQDFR
ncbi:MAG: hypothetical protein F2813_06005 [Actinobacteria bacterium]|uniref:Unannotated protein n=1 Tax=freshwater metagenome TaxID=449393 RepID=A0A6J5ZX55_9ZZZZ|nr:hypothetical protein [Actinomycetota bacterium]